jgi:hypothetical protein
MPVGLGFGALIVWKARSEHEAVWVFVVFTLCFRLWCILGISLYLAIDSWFDKRRHRGDPQGASQAA